MTKKLNLLLLTFLLAAALVMPVSASAHTKTNGVSWTYEANDIINHGNSFLGTRYLFGAKYGRTDRFDCSSFVKYIYRNYITLPRASKDQANVGYAVSKSNLRKGDLVFFNTNNGKYIVDHVAVYVGNGKIMHATPSGGVHYASFSGFWDRTYVSARRVLK